MHRSGNEGNRWFRSSATKLRPAAECGMSTAAIMLSTVLLWAGAPVWGQSTPSLRSVRPLGIAPGTTTNVTIKGGGLSGTPRLWTTLGSDTAAQIVESGSSASQAVFAVTLPTGVVPGLHALRVVTDGGASELRPFIVDELPAVLAAGDNHQPASAQSLQSPCAVSGAIPNLQRDYYRFDLPAGQRIAIEVFARRIGSPLDPVLTLFDDQGRELAAADDTPGLGGDCQLVYAPANATRCVLELRDVRYAGGDGHEYYLRIGDFPCLQSPVPLSVQRGTETSVEFAGIEVEGTPAANVAVPADWPLAWYPVAVRRAGGSTAAFTTLAVCDSPVAVDHEPNDTAEQSQRIQLGDQISGRLQAPGDRDRFLFTATQGQRFIFRGVTRQEGLPSDLVLTLFDASGKQIARADDDGVLEGRIDQNFAAAGDYALEVSDLLGRGGSAYGYRIDVEEYAPGFTLEVDLATLNVPAGGTVALPVQVTRRDYNGAIDLSVEGLPEGYRAAPARIGPGMKRTMLTITGPAGGAADLTAVRVIGTAEASGRRLTSEANTTAYMQGHWNDLPVVPPTLRRELALAGAPAGRLTLRIEPEEVTFGPNLTATVRVIATRAEDLKGDITLATNPDKEALPGNVTLELKPIPAGQNEIALQLSATEKAPLGPFSVALTGSIKLDKQTITAAAPVINYRLAAPFTLEVQPGAGTLTRGGQRSVLLRVHRNPAFTGAVKLTWKDLPAGVTVPETVIAPEQTAVEVPLSVGAEVSLAELPPLKLTAVAVDNDKLTATADLPKQKVESGGN